VSFHRPYPAWTYQSAWKQLRAILVKTCQRLPIHFHLFRKTSATRRARGVNGNKWANDELKGFHGWSRNSEQASAYILQAAESARENVYRDAGLTPTGQLVSADPVRACPSCAEQIKAAARKCRYCQETVTPVVRVPAQ
jgi:hypothetical protein